MLGLQSQTNEIVISVEQKINLWKSEDLHGKHAFDLSRAVVDKNASNAWFTTEELSPEKIGNIFTIQDGVLKTKNYRKYILKYPNIKDDLCRKCCIKPLITLHIIGVCPTLAQSNSTYRHNQVVSVIQQFLAIKHKLLMNKVPYYQYKPLSSHRK